jgi:hypothetical protein
VTITSLPLSDSVPVVKHTGRRRRGTESPGFEGKREKTSSLSSELRHLPAALVPMPQLDISQDAPIHCSKSSLSSLRLGPGPEAQAPAAQQWRLGILCFKVNRLRGYNALTIRLPTSKRRSSHFPFDNAGGYGYGHGFKSGPAVQPGGAIILKI